MTAGNRTVRLPFDHLLAELAAFPLASEAALARPLEGLDPGLDEPTADLWRAAERELLSAAPGVSLEELIALRDRCWFGVGVDPQPEGPRTRRRLQEHLRATTAQYLEPLGAGLGARRMSMTSGPDVADPTHAQARNSWMWLTFAMPEDTLLAVSGGGGQVPPSQFITPAVRDLLSRGFAETHLHVGAALDFPHLWSLLMARLSATDLMPEHLLAAGAVLAEGADLVAWLLRSAIARVVLARFLIEGQVGQGLDRFRHELAERSLAGTQVAVVNRVFADLSGGWLSPGIGLRALQDAYAALVGTRDISRVTDSATAMSLDPLAELLGCGPDSGDQRLVARMCAYLDGPEGASGADSSAARIFWQVVRIRETSSSAPSSGRAQVGVRYPGGILSHADPAANSSSGCRYARYYGRQRYHAMALANLIHTYPQVLYVVRGLDLCSDETAVPAWVFKPLLGYIRRAAGGAAGRLLATSGGQSRDRRPGVPGSRTDPAPVLRTTVHAGEDFVHLLTGLRNIHDAIRVLDLREGDRIGHGLALGVDPVAWAARVGRIAMPLEDRVFDLAWEWNWLIRRGSGVEAARIAYLAHQVRELGGRWFGHSIGPEQIHGLAEELADEAALRTAGFPTGCRPRPDSRSDASMLLTQYLTDVGTFHRGRQILWVNPGGEADAVERIAASLRAEVTALGLAVEVNPTSNLLIGDLSDLRGHPLWRMCPPSPDYLGPRLAITLGSDDPVIFNSSLPMEYQRLYDALILAGLSDIDALAWLNQVRRTGLERRFTTRAAALDQVWNHPNLSRLAPDLLGV